MTSRMLRRGFLLGALAALPSCDVVEPTEGVEIKLDLPELAIDLTSLGSLQIVPGQITSKEATVDIGRTVKSLDELEAIKFEPSAFDFAFPSSASGATSGASAGSGAAPAPFTGECAMVVMAQTRPNFDDPLSSPPEVNTAANVTVEISNNTVTSIRPTSASVDEMSTAIRRLVDVSEPWKEILPANAGTMTGDSLKETFDRILRAPSSTVTLLVACGGSGDTPLSVALDNFKLDASITLPN